MTLHRGNRRIKKLIVNGQAARFLMYRGRQVWPCRKPLPLPQLQHRMTEDSAGRWFEVGFQSLEELAGNAGDGWQDPRGYCTLILQRSADLQTWTEGGFEDCAGSPAELMDGSWEYWSRTPVPQEWFDVLSDERIVSTRYGKSITGISLGGTAVALPNYPYDMPSEAAALQADLRAAGYTGATVSSTSAALSVVVRSYYPNGALFLPVTMSGTSVTAVKEDGVTIALPGYPYTMPSQRAALQTDLRATGRTGAVVMLYGDEWEIFIPDLANRRSSLVTFIPGDPYPEWNFFGTYLGDAPGNAVNGEEENLRDPSGNPLVENKKQFVRIAVRRGPRVLP